MRLQRILNDDGLLFVLLGASAVAHISLGWLQLVDDAAPYLPNRPMGRTSVSVQLIAQHQRVELTEQASRSEMPDVFHQKFTPPDLSDYQTVLDRKATRRADEPQPRHSPDPPPKISRHESNASVVVPAAEADIPDANASKNFVSRAAEGADVPPSFKTRMDPRYPPDLLLAGVEADVNLLVTVDAQGRVIAVTVHDSSGHKAMDQSAIDAVRHWQFVPAKRNGAPIAMKVVVPVGFRIRR